MPSETESQINVGFGALAAGEWSGARDAFVGALEGVEVPGALMGLASACYWLGELGPMMQALERAYAAARRQSEPTLAAAAAMSLVGYHKQFFGNVAVARGWLAAAARIVDSEAPALRGELLGATSFVTDDPVKSEELAREAMAIGKANGNTDLELLAMVATGVALVQQCRVADGMSLLDEAMAGAVAGACSSPLTAAHAGCMTMLVCNSHFDIERASQWLKAMDAFVDRYGCPFVYAECRTHYGRILFENGDWGAAESFLSEAIALAKDQIPAAHALASGTFAELKLAQGRVEDAARVLHGVEGRDEVVAAMATLHLTRSEPALSAGLLRRRIEAAGPKRLELVTLLALLGQAELELGLGDSATLRAKALIELGAANDCQLVVALGQQLLGRALAATDARAACSHFEAALAAFVQAEVPYRAARTRLLLATALRSTDAALAAADARTALSAFEDLGAGSDADAAAALLRELGVKAARTGPKNVGRLTKREQEVLSLLGEGLSNPEIAKRLFISRKTVEHHVARVLQKLGLRGRAEAAAVAVRQA